MSVNRWMGLGVVTALAIVGTTGRPGAAANPKRLPAFVPGRVLVQFRADLNPAQADQILSGHRGRSAGRLSATGLQVVEVPAGSEAEIAAELARRPEVAFVEPDAILEPSAIPDDPDFPAQWHLPQIKAPEAWDISTGRDALTIAILDTGVDSTHPDLDSKLVPGWNVWDNSPNTEDYYGHGTKVAGTAAATGNNGAGVASVAWNCKLMPVRVTPNEGYTTYSALASGLVWAADHGARVANISFQASGSNAVADAAGYFQAHGGVVVVAAGNSGAPDTAPENPYVLTVSATGSGDGLAGFSTTGSVVDLSAPGVSINTTRMGGDYAFASGTSFSAPVVAGVAALVLSTNPGLNSAQVQAILEQSADDLGSAGWDPQYGAGRVNACRAVELAAVTEGAPDTTAPSLSIIPPADGSLSPVEVQAVDDIGIQKVSLSANGKLVGELTASPYVFTFDVKGGKDVTLTATAVDWSGNSSVSQLTFKPAKTKGPKGR